MFIRTIFSFRGYRLDLHKFVRPDDASCFHSHLAKALRIILWGGYEEEILLSEEEAQAQPDFATYIKWKWLPGCYGILRPEFVHRVDKLLNGKSSWSLWFRWPKTDEIKVYGEC